MSGRRAAPGGRTALISAAERLFAQRGIEGASLREIMREAGQRNTTALQYHFGDRNGLLEALLHKHVGSIAVERAAILDALSGRTDLGLRDVAVAFVRPLISKLAEEGGPEFLQVAVQLVNRSNQRFDRDDLLGILVYDPGGVQQRWSDFAGSFMPPGTVGAPLHRRFAAMRFAYIEVGRRAREAPRADQTLFTSQLVDLFVALLGAEVSPETARIMESRRRTRAHRATRNDPAG